MDWQGVGVLVAMAAIVVSFLMSWRGQHQQRLIAEATAARAEAAARLTAVYTERVVIALEAIAQEGFGRPRPWTAVPPGVRWAMTHVSGGNYSVTNVGSATAYAVELSGHPTLIGPTVVAGGPDLPAQEMIMFVAETTLTTRDLTITVTWTDSPGGDRRTWMFPLPPR